MNDIDVISFHKGFTKIIDIWLSINENTTKRLGIVRDFDNEAMAAARHDKYNKYSNICIQTTREYTLEPEIVKTGDNYKLLKNKYGEECHWLELTPDQLADDWRSSKSSVMLRLCHDLSRGELPTFAMPKHIQTIIDFMETVDTDMVVNETNGD